MKNCVLLYMIVLPALAFAQFPAPESFAITVNYILEDQSDWCDGHIIQGPAYCNLFSWEVSDTASTPATLTGYRIYKDSVFFLSTTHTLADTAGGYMASFYVTATYEAPAGESEPSNMVVISDLPMTAEEADNTSPIWIGFDLSGQMLVVHGARYARSLRVYDMRGVLVWSTEEVSETQLLEGLGSGVYGVVVLDKYGSIRSKLILMGL